MDLRDLKLFLHLCDSRYFGRTAKAMHLSPSTLSRQTTGRGCRVNPVFT